MTDDQTGEPKPRLVTRQRDVLYCSFCGKNQDEVRKLIAGPTVFICNECVALCVSICDGTADEEDRRRDEASERMRRVRVNVRAKLDDVKRAVDDMRREIDGLW